MRRRQIPESAVYEIIGDHDERTDRPDDVTEYRGIWSGRALLVVVRRLDEDETDGYVLTAIDLSTRASRRHHD